MCKFCWFLVVLLLAAAAAAGYKFIVQGDVVEGEDGRAAIRLNKGEKDLVLSEMRIFLQSVQQITAGIGKQDMALVATAARRSGRGAQLAVPPALIGKLPLAFKKLGFDTHGKFDELALDAEQFGDRDHVLGQLDALLQNCVACHAAYRFEVASTPAR